MIAGIGVDIVSASEMKKLIDSMTYGALLKLFTEREVEASSSKKDKAEYLAGRFASKEACFKAIAPCLAGEQFDLRITETLSREDGSPYINVTDEMKEVLKRAGISALKVSISHDNGMAIAFAAAEK